MMDTRALSRSNTTHTPNEYTSYNVPAIFKEFWVSNLVRRFNLSNLIQKTMYFNTTDLNCSRRGPSGANFSLNYPIKSKAKTHGCNDLKNSHCLVILGSRPRRVLRLQWAHVWDGMWMRIFQDSRLSFFDSSWKHGYVVTPFTRVPWEMGGARLSKPKVLATVFR